MRPRYRYLRVRAIAGALAIVALAPVAAGIRAERSDSGPGLKQQAPAIGGGYAALQPRRQRLIDDWVARLNQVAGLSVEPGPFYDERLRVSTRTTFEAVTHALMTTSLTGASGTRFGDGLDLIERIDSVSGQVPDAPGDLQFRVYAVLTNDALDKLSRSNEFKRGADNTVYHRGYPTSYRAQGGSPSIQISIATDGRRADVDVDYRASSFPAALFNGHLTSSNSDVRAGNNYDRHVNRWGGFQNWWRSFLGIRVDSAPDTATKGDGRALPSSPRAGKQKIEVMAQDFLQAWLVEGNVLASMGYISSRAFACMAEAADDPMAFDRGMAPFRLMNALKAAKDAVGPRESLEGLIAGVRLANPALRVVTQPHHAQFVTYSVPDDIAVTFDCESRLNSTGKPRSQRVYGHYYGSVFYVPAQSGPRGQTVALLWAKEKGYWKVVSWRAEPEGEATLPPASPPAEAPKVRITADPTLVRAAKGFLDSWLLRKDHDSAFGYLSPAAYACYDLERPFDQPAAASAEDAGQKIRAGLEVAGGRAGKARRLGDVVEAVPPSNPVVRVMEHEFSREFALTSVPTALADAAGCAARARGQRVTGEAPLEYGTAFGMNLRLRAGGSGAPVLRMLWTKEAGAWRITAYGIEFP